MDMKKWLSESLAEKKPLPILSYPGAEFTGATVTQLVNDAQAQADAVKAVADRCPASAAVTVMDLSVEAECFGAKIRFSDSAVPAVIGITADSPESAAALSVPEVGSGRSGVFIDAVKKAKLLIVDRPVFAGAAGPFSLAARLFGVTESMLWCIDEPETVELVLDKCTEFLINYIKALKNAGADGLILAEPVAGLLSPVMEEVFSAPYIKRIAEAVGDDEFCIVYHNCGAGVVRMTDSIFSNGCDAYHFGNVSDLTVLLAASDGKPVLGNIDPVACFKDGTTETMKKAVDGLLAKCGDKENFLLSSGCDIPPGAKWENIDAFFGAAKEFYAG